MARFRGPRQRVCMTPRLTGMGRGAIRHAMDLSSGQPLDIALPRSLAAEHHGEVALLRLSRPEKRNALDDETILDSRRSSRDCRTA